MGENTEELVVSLENSLSSDICDTVGDLAEVGLDAVMDDGILKDIPILSTVVGLYRIGHTIRERHEIKQLALFVAELNRGCTDESKRKQLLEKLNSDTRKSKQEIEYILVVLDNYLEYEKSQMLGKIVYCLPRRDNYMGRVRRVRINGKATCSGGQRAVKDKPSCA